MCGRYELKAKARDLNRHFPQLHLGQGEMPHAVEFHPTDSVLMITRHLNGHLGGKARWGLVGSFLDQPPRSPLINLRSEGLVAKPFYSKILRRNPATAFFEWQPVAGKKLKNRISQTNGELLMLAGVYDHHPNAGTTCAILTTAADVSIRSIHDRMPLILGREESSFWLNEYAEFPDDEFAALLQMPVQPALSIEAIIEEAPSPQLSLIFA